MKKASVIIPNWNGKEFLKNCLLSLEAQTFKDFEVIVVDNGSTDDSVEFVKKNFPEFKVLEQDHNIGFSPAVNRGINEAEGEYLILLNNDTKADNNCLKYLVQAADRYPEVGMVAAKMLNFYNPKLLDSAGDFIDAVGHANNIGFGVKDGPEFNREGLVFLVCGGGALFKRQMLDKVGLFDESFFAYFEDVDLGLRAQLLGFKGWYEPKAIIYHIHKATSVKVKAFSEYLQFRNMTMTVIKDFPMRLLVQDFNWLKVLLVNINTIRFLAGEGYLKEALQAELYILLNLPRLIVKRFQIQSSKVAADSYIIENVRPKKVTLFGLLKEGF